MNKIGVLGSGTMGAGIVQVFALKGYEVFVRARRETSVKSGVNYVSKNLDKLIAKGKMLEETKIETMKRIHGSTDISIIADVDLVIEAATEDIASKKALFAEIDAICKPDTIFATNTSSLSITEIGSATKRPDKVIGMHFFNPVPVMSLVEVIKGLVTSDEVKNKTIDLISSIGKRPIEVEESPGFVVNRILVPMINEGVGILAEGIAKAEEIDQAMTLGANHPMGPLELGDLIGLDVCLAVMEVLHTEFGDDKYRPHPLLKKMVRAGKLGRKSGEGFFVYR